MTDSSTSHAIPLTSLLAEIEATPKEYWAELLNTLRQFRQELPKPTPTIIDADQAHKNQAAIDLMNSWIENDDPAEHKEALDFLEKAIDEDRLSDRPLFP
ncbi:MAG: hypothetical protein AAFQ40_03305 [Cyanobacteria bacterium J06623_5]